VVLVSLVKYWQLDEPVKGVQALQQRLTVEDEPTPVPYMNLDTSQLESISAAAYLVKKMGEPVVITGKRYDLPRAPASTTKIMTALVALQDYKLDEVVSNEVVKVIGSQIGLRYGEQLSVENMLFGLMLASGNDVAESLAVYHLGGRERFVQRMNEMADELGLKNTRFANPSGLDESGHYASAADLATIAEYGLSQPVFARIVNVSEAEIRTTDGRVAHHFVNLNELLNEDLGVTGVKTGYTDLAGDVLVTSVRRGEDTYIFVVMGSEDRFADTRGLIQWLDEVVLGREGE